MDATTKEMTAREAHMQGRDITDPAVANALRPSCALCTHVPVCKVAHAFNALVGQMSADGVEPCEGGDMAAICQYYDPTRVNGAGVHE